MTTPHTQEYIQLYNSCYRVRKGQKSKDDFDTNAINILKLHSSQTLTQIKELKEKWTPETKKIFFGQMKLSDLWIKLALTVDTTDVALYNSSQLIHCIQCYISLKKDKIEDEKILLFSLLHDIGKTLSLLGETDENVDGMNHIYNLNKDSNNICKLNDIMTSFNHDEFGYYLLKDITPRYIHIGTRYHSCDEIFKLNKYLSKEEINDLDVARKFYEYDHNSKSPYWCPINVNILNECIILIDKYFPEPHNF